MAFMILNRFNLSVRESEIAVMLSQGKSRKEMADKLSISIRTVDIYLAKIYAATDTVSIHHCAVTLVRAGW